jgi:hypothetical protein
MGIVHSKASNIFLAREAHHENPDLIIFALNPGGVKTWVVHLRIIP